VFFGEENVKIEAEKVAIYNDQGQLEQVSFAMAFRTVWRQTLSKLNSFPRLFLLDPLTDWCLTPWEFKVKRNQNAIKQFLRDKKVQYVEWRKNNQISGSDDVFLLADLLGADKKKFENEEIIIDELIACFYEFSATTASVACQTLYQLIKCGQARDLVMKDL